MIQRLLTQPQGYDLFQAIGLLEQAADAAFAGERGGTRPEAVRLRAHVSLGFPSGEIATIHEGIEPGGEPFTLHTAVMTLAGVGGPLPLAFTEWLLERRASHDLAGSDFLDIFHHRFLTFLHRGRKKRRLALNWRSAGSFSPASVLDAMGALDGREGAGGDGPWLRHAGLLGLAPRSLPGLLQLLRDRTGLRIEGRSFVGGWRCLEAAPGLGKGVRLGRDAVLGRRWWDPGAGIVLRFPSLAAPQLTGLLPGGADHLRLKRWVHRHLQQDLHVAIDAETVHGPDHGSRLGTAKPAYLGWTSWLGARAGQMQSCSAFRLSPRLHPSLQAPAPVAPTN